MPSSTSASHPLGKPQPTRWQQRVAAQAHRLMGRVYPPMASTARSQTCAPVGINLGVTPEVMVQVAREFRTWTTWVQRAVTAGQMQFPYPDEWAGLPPHWDLAAWRGHAGSLLVLVQRKEGGWLLLRHLDDATHQKVLVMWVSPSLGPMYERAVARPDGGHPDMDAAYDRIAAWLQGVLVHLYDPNDPVEAAEQVLVALGSPMRVVPRAAWEH